MYSHAGAFDEATRTGCKNFNKVEFLAALGAICAQAFTRSILFSFIETGLLPFCPMPLLNKMQEHQSKVIGTREEEHNSCLQTPSTTRAPAVRSALTSSLTVRTLKRQAEFLMNGPISPGKRCHLAQFIKGCILQANTCTLVKDSIEKSQVAENARAGRKPSS